MIHESILGTIGNTPVVRINHLAPAGTTMYVKCEAFNPLSSVKDRLAIGIIEDAERRGTIKPGQTVIEATSGNTGIALAMVCAVKGYPFVAIMSDSFSVERRKLMRILGAKVILTPAAERGSGMVKKAEEMAKKNGWFLRAAVREPGQSRVPPQHDGPRDPARLRRQAARLVGDGLRHRRDADRRQRHPAQGAAGNEDRRRRARRRGAAGRPASGSPTRSRAGRPTSSPRSWTARASTSS